MLQQLDADSHLDVFKTISNEKRKNFRTVTL
jgi:hypothetical protein